MRCLAIKDAELDMIKESELVCKQKNTFEDIEIKLNIVTA